MEKNPKSNKNLLILAVLMIIFITAAFMAYSRFVSDQELVDVKINRVTSEQLSSKELDLSVLDDPRFVKFRPVDFKAPDINSINVGKENPFQSGQ